MANRLELEKLNFTKETVEFLDTPKKYVLDYDPKKINENKKDEQLAEILITLFKSVSKQIREDAIVLALVSLECLEEFEHD